MRKTIAVELLKEKVNKFLAESDEKLNSERLGQAMLLSNFLHDTGNYKGFYYLGNSANCDA